MGKCTKCNHPVAKEDMFCNECGTRVEKELEKDEQKEYCIHCGHLSDGSTPFCVECGKTKETEEVLREVRTSSNQVGTETETAAFHRSEEAAATEAENVKVRPQQQTKVKQPMAKWKKLLIVTGLLIVVLAFGTYKYLERHFDPIHDLVKMDEAILSNDVNGFMDFVQVEKDVAFDKDTYFAYMKENEWDEGLKDEYYALIEREKIEPTPLQKELFGYDGATLFTVKDESILFGLFKGYSLHAVPVELTGITNLEHTEIHIQDETYRMKTSGEENKLGDFYPGSYEFKATSKADYGEFIIEDTIVVDASGYAELDINFQYESFYVETDYDFDDAIVFVNGESTKQKVSELGEVGPIPLDSKVKFHAEWKDEKDKLYRSNTVEIDEDNYGTIYLEFDERIALDAEDAEDMDYEAAQFILDFRSAYEYAVNYVDYDEIAPYMKEGSDEEKDLKKFINDMGKADYYYDFDETTVTNVTKNDDKKIEIETSEQFVFHDEDGSVYEYDRDKVYFVELVDDEPKVYKIDYKDTKKKRIN